MSVSDAEGIEETPMESAFNIVCAWCQCLMRAAGMPAAPTSHAICDGCFNSKLEDLKIERRQRQRSKVKARPASKPVTSAS
jgi:hypothetical protein